MGLLSAVNPLSMLSNAAEAVCDAVLPPEMEFVGDLVSIGIDFQTGNAMGGIANFADLTQDLPQQVNSLTRQAQATRGALAGAMEDSGWQHTEPGPPPQIPKRTGFAPHEHSVSAPALRGAAPAIAALMSGVEDPGGARPGREYGPADVGVSGRTSDPTHLDGVATNVPTAAASSIAAPAELANLNSTAATTNASADTAAAPPAATATAEAPKTGTADDFFKLSDKDLMNAVRDGKLPKEVSSDPQQMQRLQMRMNEISEMNKLITSMLAAMHDMNSQIIQNIRV